MFLRVFSGSVIHSQSRKWTPYPVSRRCNFIPHPVSKIFTMPHPASILSLIPPPTKTYVNPQYCLCYISISMKRIKNYKFKARKSQEAMDTYKENSIFFYSDKFERKETYSNTMKLTGCTKVLIIFHVFITMRAWPRLSFQPWLSRCARDSPREDRGRTETPTAGNWA